MNLAIAEDQALKLIYLHLGDLWSFKWINTVTYLGKCDYTNNQIQLSKPFVQHNPETRVLDTILHEIAHAYCKDEGHGPGWRHMCSVLGANPKSLGEAHMPSKYRMFCSVCGYSFLRHRKPNKTRLLKMACGVCCGKYNGGKFHSQYAMKLVKVDPNVVYITSP